LLVAAGNDFAYVLQAVAPNFVWKTTAFPAAKKGFLYSIVLQVLLSKFPPKLLPSSVLLTFLLFATVFWTATIQLLLWRDKKRAAKTLSEDISVESSIPPFEPSDLDEKKTVHTEEVPVV
jgi:ACS family pantothenate transporter-like MFS transporter